ncbi:hypothetical protein [Streptomyces sp. 8N616]|uniref:hypothetical protein n=1 Tax=Streptomyces sp. 8N616 TaxID=3457414 RepID=UPI003FD5DAA8
MTQRPQTDSGAPFGGLVQLGPGDKVVVDGEVAEADERLHVPAPFGFDLDTTGFGAREAEATGEEPAAGA